MSNKFFSDETYYMFDGWRNFLLEAEQNPEEEMMLQVATADEERARAEAEQVEAQIIAIRQNAAPIIAETLTLIFQLSQKGTNNLPKALNHAIRVGRSIEEFSQNGGDLEKFLTELNTILRMMQLDLK